MDSAFDAELYFNLHTATHPGGEVRGQIVRDEAGGNGGTAIPLPSPLLAGLAGLSAAGWAARRRTEAR